MIILFSFLFVLCCYIIFGGFLVLYYMDKSYAHKRSFIEIITWGDFFSYVMIWPIIIYALQKHKEKNENKK